ncbi:MAG: universal stress protein [Betaproteobacteria bacterium]|jgi:nucleotide-binding universal stress UspA family protein|nr:universal stress protein [Betaproteobacteria bacterium]
MYKRIMVATDGSHLSQKAVLSAIEMALQFKAELLAVNVIPHYIQAYFEGSFAVSEVDSQKIEEQWAHAAQKILDKVVEQAKSKGVDAQTAVVKSDDIAQGVIDKAGSFKADVIVMASHGRKGLKRLLLGSETLAVLTHAKVPVLVLR